LVLVLIFLLNIFHLILGEPNPYFPSHLPRDMVDLKCGLWHIKWSLCATFLLQVNIIALWP
jgi:hypothetical protein